jgi:hypothetical protein
MDKPLGECSFWVILFGKSMKLIAMIFLVFLHNYFWYFLLSFQANTGTHRPF